MSEGVVGEEASLFRSLFLGKAIPRLDAVPLVSLVVEGRQYYDESVGRHHDQTKRYTCGFYRKKLVDNPQYKSHVFWRWFNEVPVFALVIIVILVVVKPF